MDAHHQGAVTTPLTPAGAFLLGDLSDKHRDLFLEGQRLFNERLFWEAHEAWEEVWKEKQDPQKRLIQGLIQAAAAYHLVVTRPRMNGAVRNIEKALGKFEGMPPVCFGIEVGRLVEMLRQTHAEVKRIGQDGLPEIAEKFVPTL